MIADDKIAAVHMSPFGPNRPLLNGQSTSALPGQFRRPPVLLLRVHHRLLFRGSEQYSQSLYALAEAARRSFVLTKRGRGLYGCDGEEQCPCFTG